MLTDVKNTNILVTETQEQEEGTLSEETYFIAEWAWKDTNNWYRINSQSFDSVEQATAWSFPETEGARYRIVKCVVTRSLAKMIEQ